MNNPLHPRVFLVYHGCGFIICSQRLFITPEGIGCQMATEELQDGRYHRLRLLGSGGMGEVYLMQDSRVSRQVAIKVIRSEATAYPDRDTITDATRLFQREARAIAALEHANILPLYDYGEETRDGTTMTYMVMPYCADGSLQDYLRQHANQLLPLPTVAYLIEQAAEALQYAHEHDVIHLDVKPSNFLLRGNKKNPDRPTLLLADFGIARNFTTVASASRTIRGTPTSMAPEQWSSDPVIATDQYALAVMAYEMLAGRPPFVGGMEQLMYQHFSVQPQPPSTFNPRLPVTIDAVILRALAKKPSERYPSVADFASALMKAAQQASDESADSQVSANSEDSANYATLDISQSEANAGISRLITLPGGKKMNVPIPAGVRNGQVIRLPDPNGSSSADEMVLTVAIKDPREGRISADTANTEASLNLQRAEPQSGYDLPTIAPTPTPAMLQVSSPVTQPPTSPAPKRVSAQRVGLIALIGVFVVLVLVGTIFLYASHQNNPSTAANATGNHTTPTVSVKPTATPSPQPTATPPPPGLYIAGTYNGSILNATTQQTTYITVFIVQSQGSGALKGSVTFKSSPQGVYLLNGTVDMQGNFSFSVQQPAGKTPLIFYGTVQSSYLKGDYCSATTGPCLSNTGNLYAGPRY